MGTHIPGNHPRWVGAWTLLSGIIFLATLVWSCAPPDKKSPTSAFSRLAPCLDKQAPECVFGELNRDSRWSIHTIFRTLREIQTVAQKTYPTGNADQALGSWKEEAQASDPPDLFRVYCDKRNCLKPLLDGFGAVTQTTAVSESKASVTTTRGRSFELIKNENNWGIALYDKELQQAKIRLLDRLKQVRKNGREFEQQKLATGGGDGEKETP